MICDHGIYVFESKNFSGYIFGNENQKNCTQTLKGSNNKVIKHQFYNPIMQNATHIRHLQNYLKTDFSIFSVIAFSERCSFKSLTINSKDVFVVHRNSVINIWQKNSKYYAKLLSTEHIEKLYQFLYPLTQVSNKVKTQHIREHQSYSNKN